MATRIHMQDQVKNRIESIMRDDKIRSLDDCAQTVATLLIVFVFLIVALGW